MKHPLSKGFCFTRNLARRKIWSLDRVECKRHIGVLIIDEGTEYALRQSVCFIAQLFASLVKLFRDVFWSSGVLETHHHQRESGPSEGLYAIVVAQFLHCSLRARVRRREEDELQALRPVVLGAGFRRWLLGLHPVGVLVQVEMKLWMWKGSVTRYQAPFHDQEQMRSVLAACQRLRRR